jgi:predicted enzyme related to lactoylglutathione lyase
LTATFIDVPHRDYARSVQFWEAALDRPAEVEPGDPSYTSLGQPTPGVSLTVQSVGDDVPRIHLDLETDDVDAEVARLVGLGASVVDRVEDWVILRDPAQVVFCVVPVQDQQAFEASATAWDQPFG